MRRPCLTLLALSSTSAVPAHMSDYRRHKILDAVDRVKAWITHSQASQHAASAWWWFHPTIESGNTTEQKQQPKRCQPTLGWCVGADAAYLEVDCDGDGILDPFCANILAGKRWQGYIGSASDCLDTFPCVSSQCECNLNLEPKNQSACPRPADWCASGVITDDIDCDGDGVPDPLCRGTTRSEDGHQQIGFIGSATLDADGNRLCEDNWPHGVCAGGARVSLSVF